MEDKLRKLQLTELEILKVIDKICTEHDIKYSLIGGTLIGAVRHKGFVPWDDDLDIRMSRLDYERFIKVWNSIQPEGYYLQNKRNTPAFPQSFTKIRKNNTAFVLYESENKKYHTGIFVDVFPLDRIPNGRLRKKWFLFRALIYQIFTRESDYQKNNKLIDSVVAILLKVTTKKYRKKYRDAFEKKLVKYSSQTNWNCVAIDALSTIGKELPNSIADSYTRLEFEGQEFMCFSDWDTYLKTYFGDYMQLPPVEERTWTHHPLIIGFENEHNSQKE